MRRSLLFAIAVAAALTPSVLSSRVDALSGNTLARPQDPVVLTGANVPLLIGLDPSLIVAFRWKGTWQQLPLQVDERATLDFCEVYNVSPGQGIPCGITESFYTDAGTFTGPDPNAMLDADDEIAFMSRDAGGVAPNTSYPAHTIAGSGQQALVTDLLNGATSGYVYLFRSDGTLSSGAGQQYVDYTFSLASGPYLTTYDTLDGPNPENSTVVTPNYSHHFADRWISDAISITAGGATGVDILDRHKNLFAPGSCVRTEDTFSDGEGAFVANREGPVRTIRSYVGANSGPLTERTHIFYDQREDIVTFLRVHPISGVMDVFDYTLAASGMTYRNNVNAGPFTIDGADDAVTLGALQWELVAGAQGSLTTTQRYETNLPGFAPTSYYLDDTTPPVTQCTGDAFAYGTSGPRINQPIACTDPSGPGCTSYLRNFRINYYEAPGATASTAQARYAQSTTPLTYQVTPYGAGVGGIAAAPDVSMRDQGPGVWLYAAVVAIAGLLLGASIARSRAR